MSDEFPIQYPVVGGPYDGVKAPAANPQHTTPLARTLGLENCSVFRQGDSTKPPALYQFDGHQWNHLSAHDEWLQQEQKEMYAKIIEDFKGSFPP